MAFFDFLLILDAFKNSLFQNMKIFRSGNAKMHRGNVLSEWKMQDKLILPVEKVIISKIFKNYKTAFDSYI